MTQRYIQDSARDCGDDLLEKVTRQYVAEKSVSQIMRFFDIDFCEQLGDAKKAIDLEGAGRKTGDCADCKQTKAAALLMDWDGEIICQDCTRTRRNASRKRIHWPIPAARYH